MAEILFLAGLIDSRCDDVPWVCVMKQVTSVDPKVLLKTSSVFVQIFVINRGIFHRLMS